MLTDEERATRDDAIISSRFPAGAVIAGKYRVEAILGQGGMGLVLRARHDALERTVAIKVLLANVAGDAAAVARFVREARALAKLESEHIVGIIDFGTLDDGSPFIVMDHLQGTDLGDLLERRGALPIDTAVSYVLQVLEALAEAHGMGIVHRDLKPANLFLTTKSNGRSVVKILDFGISKGATAVADANLTSTRTIMGSPSYMSPEQIRATRDVDARSDIWSMGVVLYELLTGVQPFPGDTVGEVLSNVVEANPRLPHTLRPDLPLALEHAIMRCLARGPDARFQSVGELAAALEPFTLRGDASSSQRLVVVAPVSAADARPFASTSALESPSPLPTANDGPVQKTGLVHTSVTGARLERRRTSPLIFLAILCGVVAIVATALVARDRRAPSVAGAATPPSASSVTHADPVPAARASEMSEATIASAPAPVAVAASALSPARPPVVTPRRLGPSTTATGSASSPSVVPAASTMTPRGDPLDIRN